jgi:hypothetical protein
LAGATPALGEAVAQGLAAADQLLAVAGHLLRLQLAGEPVLLAQLGRGVAEQRVVADRDLRAAAQDPRVALLDRRVVVGQL